MTKIMINYLSNMRCHPEKRSRGLIINSTLLMRIMKMMMTMDRRMKTRKMMMMM